MKLINFEKIFPHIFKIKKDVFDKIIVNKVKKQVKDYQFQEKVDKIKQFVLNKYINEDKYLIYNCQKEIINLNKIGYFLYLEKDRVIEYGSTYEIAKPWIISMVQYYILCGALKKDDLDDIISDITFTFLKKMKEYNFDDNRNALFYTYIYHWIRGVILKWIKKTKDEKSKNLTYNDEYKNYNQNNQNNYKEKIGLKKEDEKEFYDTIIKVVENFKNETDKNIFYLSFEHEDKKIAEILNKTHVSIRTRKSENIFPQIISKIKKEFNDLKLAELSFYNLTQDPLFTNYIIELRIKNNENRY